VVNSYESSLIMIHTHSACSGYLNVISILQRNIRLIPKQNEVNTSDSFYVLLVKTW